MRTTLLASLALVLSLGASSCTGTRLLSNPTLQLQTQGGTELGVSTDYGVVFLGRTATTGEVEITAFFGDGPSIEPTVIEPVGGGLYTAETEIRLPDVPIRFIEPIPGERLYLKGMSGTERWTEEVTVLSDPRVEGILIEVPKRLRNDPSQIGAGLFWMPEEDDLLHMELVGLVSGRIRFERGADVREYMTIAGPTSLWRLVAHRRNQLERERWIYRNDIL